MVWYGFLRACLLSESTMQINANQLGRREKFFYSAHSKITIINILSVIANLYFLLDYDTKLWKELSFQSKILLPLHETEDTFSSCRVLRESNLHGHRHLTLYTIYLLSRESESEQQIKEERRILCSLLWTKKGTSESAENK